MRTMRMWVLLLGGLAMLIGCVPATQETAPATATPPVNLLAAEPSPPEFRIERMTPYPAAGNPSGLAVAPLGFDLAISFPSVWGGNGTFAITVDGQPVELLETGGGTGGGRSTQSFRIYPGAPGPKTVAISYDNNGIVSTARRETEFVSAGGLYLLDRPSGQLLLEPASLSLLAYFVSGIQFTWNGAALETTVPPVADRPGVITLTPAYQPGRNRLTMSWRDQAGIPQTAAAEFYSAPGGKVKRGDAVSFGYGELGSRSGPFYELLIAETTFDSAADQHPAWFPTYANRQLGFGNILVQTLTAKEPGPATVVIQRKSNFLLQYSPWRETVLTVEP